MKELFVETEKTSFGEMRRPLRDIVSFSDVWVLTRSGYVNALVAINVVTLEFGTRDINITVDIDPSLKGTAISVVLTKQEQERCLSKAICCAECVKIWTTSRKEQQIWESYLNTYKLTLNPEPVEKAPEPNGVIWPPSD